jgi:maltose alpha-D-glucosyltransferase/alpha-amylase
MGPRDTPFAPELFDPFSLRGACHSMTSRASLVLQRLESNGAESHETERLVRERLRTIENVFRQITDLADPGLRIRVHGDLHLGQVLHTGDDVVFIDFEGDSNRPLGERSMKTTPLVDVASMLHSLRYAATSATSNRIAGAFAWDRHPEELSHWTDVWYRNASVAFIGEYRRIVGSSPLVPSSHSDFERLLRSCYVAKAVYQIAYEMEHRPDWLPVAMRTFLDITQPANHSVQDEDRQGTVYCSPRRPTEGDSVLEPETRRGDWD